MDKWAHEFPEHSRTSCSDANRANAHPSGKWCERCTALVMDDAQPPAVGVDVDYTVEEVDAVIDAATARGTRHVPIECIEQMRTVLHAALRTGGGADHG